MRRVLGLALGMALLGGAQAWAGMPVQTEMKCAVGGEKFVHVGTASYSTWGARPDGKPYGSWTFPLEIPECPGNGLVMFKDFSKDELGKLKGLLASADYQALRRTGEAPYYRAAWLARALDPAAQDSLWLLLEASWQADGIPDQKARYQREFAERVEALDPRPQGEEGLALLARAANARRELGEFDAARARLAALPREGRPEGWLEYLKQLDVLIARKDADAEPLDAVPPQVAAGRCLRDATVANSPVCATEEVAKMVEEMRKWDEPEADSDAPAAEQPG